jgi:ferritin-like metal-binding protein YciE
MIAENLFDLFQRYLELAYDGEQHLLKELPKLIEVVSSSHLREGWERSLELTKIHIERLEQIFSRMDRAAATETNHAIRALTNETEKLIKHIDRSPLLDTALIVVNNEIAHNKIVLYGVLASLARLQGMRQISPQLELSLADEKSTDAEFTEMAVSTVNPEAVGFQNSPHGVVII